MYPVLRNGDPVQWVRHRGWAVVGAPGPLWAGHLRAPWARGPGLCGPPGPLWGGPL